MADAEALRDFLQELDQGVIDANRDLIVSVFQRMGSEPGPLVTYYPQVAFIENCNKLAVVKRHGCKPRLALFALLKMFAPRYHPWLLFYRRGLKEFLAACGVHEPSASAAPCGAVVAEGGDEPSASADTRVSAFAEGGDEGPRRVVFDLENISQHEKAAGAKSPIRGDP